MKRLYSVVMLLALLAPVLSMTGCSAGASASTTQVQMADMSALPAQMQSAPARVREAYQFAVANPEPLKNVPCYCGCGAMGHTSNYSCFIKSDDGQGKIVFDQHALGCSLCVDIAQDVLRLTKEGKSPGDIHSYITSVYSKFGPANQ